jgi:hypothetical protein
VQTLMEYQEVLAVLVGVVLAQQQMERLERLEL